MYKGIYVNMYAYLIFNIFFEFIIFLNLVIKNTQQHLKKIEYINDRGVRASAN